MGCQEGSYPICWQYYMYMQIIHLPFINKYPFVTLTLIMCNTGGKIDRKGTKSVHGISESFLDNTVILREPWHFQTCFSSISEVPHISQRECKGTSEIVSELTFDVVLHHHFNVIENVKIDGHIFKVVLQSMKRNT